MTKSRPWRDGDAVACIHTALTPLRVVPMPQGVVRVVSMRCLNCDAVLVWPRDQQPRPTPRNSPPRSVEITTPAPGAE